MREAEEIPIFYKEVDKIINYLIDEKRVKNKTEFARGLGMTLQNLNGIFAQKVINAQSKMIRALLTTYEVNPSFFFLPDAPMFLEEQKDEQEVNAILNENRRLKREIKVLGQTIQQLTDR